MTQRVIKRSGDKLLFWAEENGIRHTRLAEMLCLEYPHVWRLLTSRSRPGWPTLLKIKKITNGQVTPDDFALPLLHECEKPVPIEPKKLKRVAA